MRWALILLLLVGCSEAERPQPDGGVGPEADAEVVCEGPRTCHGSVLAECIDGELIEQDCADDGLVCTSALGCVSCPPGHRRCDDQASLVCRPDGSGYDEVEACDAEAGFVCEAASGSCVDLCEQAEANRSYIGCEYYPTVTANPYLQAGFFSFAVVVANAHPVPTLVRISRDGDLIREVTIQAEGVATIELPWVDALRTSHAEKRTTLQRGGAYHLISSVPVTVYQFNPLEYANNEGDCPGEPFWELGDGRCFSYSNDASLLLPAHAATGSYMVMSRATQAQGVDARPGFFTVIGADEGPVSVRITLGGRAIATDSFPASAAGETAEVTLGPGDVLQVIADAPSCEGCPGGEEYDLTGTEVHAEGRVLVLGGHACAYVPDNQAACDHLEESMLPVENWGRDFVVSATEPVTDEGNLVRVLSATDGNTVTFDPPVQAPTTLNRGEWVEVEVTSDVRVVGTDPLLVGQFMVGQGVDSRSFGDPSFSLAVPTEQYRRDYIFLAPSTYSFGYVNVTVEEGQSVFVDGREVRGFRSVGGSRWVTARHPVNGGRHHIESDAPFGIMVYGFGDYTSYLYPGGLDLNPINVPF